MAMLEYCERVGLEPYPEQERAFEALAEDNHVVLATPTGSGKSLVALAAHFIAFWRGHKAPPGAVPEHRRRSVYTAPTKALVNEKFFNLCDAFGPDHVGLMTGDSTINEEAPIICCTAEILESMALREGATTPFGWVVMDEFHFYADPQRGTAWLIPLVEMTDARFLLMSATLRDPQAICDDLERRTGNPAVLVQSSTRPVPLEFEYRDNLLLETLADLRRRQGTPAYVVSFTKRDAANLAEQVRKTPWPDDLKEADRDRGKLVEARLAGHRFDTPFGKKLRTLLPRGLAVHHGGMLPRYRRLVERLASEGLVIIISGTDTLGVGVNMPIRSVVFSQLYKWDGRGSRQLNSREFRQIAGRAGRKGHDDVGAVLVQAPEHEVRNARKKAKATALNKKFHPEKAPHGFKGWNEGTMKKLIEAQVAPLATRFQVTGPLVLQILHRAGDGRAALDELIRSVGEDVDTHLEQAGTILEAFEERAIVRRLDTPDAEGRHYDVTAAEPLAVSFDRPLVPFVRAAIDALDAEDPDYDLDALSLVESMLDDPRTIIRAQIRVARDAKYNELKQPGQSIEERNAMLEALDAVEHPQPLAEMIAVAFRTWDEAHPYIAPEPPRAKSVARDLLERGDTFPEYVKRYELIHDEHTLLYYLADCLKVLDRVYPAEERPPALDQLALDLGALIEHVDSSVAEEWARHGEAAPDLPETDDTERVSSARLDGLLRRMARTRAFEWVRRLAERDYAALAGPHLSEDDLREQIAPYWEQHEEIVISPDARGPDFFEFDPETGAIRQTILDPHDERQWVIEGTADMEASRAAGGIVARVDRVRGDS
jgi:superfamily II RNA helicase